MFNKVTPLSEPTRFDGGSEPVCEVRGLTSESNLGHSQTDLPRSLREFGTATDLGPNVPIGRWQCVERILTTRSDHGRETDGSSIPYLFILSLPHTVADETFLMSRAASAQWHLL